MEIEEQWINWQSKNPIDKFENIDFDELRKLVIKELEYASKMDVCEYTLYLKWVAMRKKFPIHNVNTLYGNEIQLIDIGQKEIINNIKNNIWTANNIDDYQKLKPRLIYTGSISETKYNSLFGQEKIIDTSMSKLSDVQTKLGLFVASNLRGHTNIGRNLNYIVEDEITGKYLGLICISSDFLDLTARDKHIGWDRELKTKKMIGHTGIGSIIVPTQPLGFNYVGGKLLALLCLSDEVQNRWKSIYGDVLAGVTTTSLYGKTKMGGLSQYDRLKYWKKMGYSAGSVSYEPTKDTIKIMLTWLKKNYPRKYFEWYVAVKESGQPHKRDHRNRSYSFIYRKMKIPKELISSKHQRGIYFSELYENTNDFLCGNITEDKLIKKFDTSYENLVDIWKERYAKKRITSLIKNDRVSDQGLFYDDMLYLTWEETKDKYLGEIGR